MIKNCVILNAGQGKRTKSFGPKCLFQLADNKTLLERQVDILQEYHPDIRIYHGLGFEYEKILNECPWIDESHTYVNNAHASTNHFFTLMKTINKFRLSNCLVMHGDLVFGRPFVLSDPKETTVFCSDLQNKDRAEIGCVTDDEWNVKNMMWGLPDVWTQISYLNKRFIDFAQSFYREDIYKKAYLIEIINLAISEGIEVKKDILHSDFYDIDSTRDIDRANEKFNLI